MKKKLIITTLILSILFSLNSFNVYAATLSKSVLQDSILKFFDGRKLHLQLLQIQTLMKAIEIVI